jgi:UDP-glucuronate 4-epimerase
VSIYGATKVANEAMARAYGATHKIPTTGLRFFNVYGPHCRPNSMFYLFAEAIRKGEPIKLYNDGQSVRNFVYVDDVVRAIIAALSRPVIGGIYNIASFQTTAIDDAVQLFQEAYGSTSPVQYLPKRPGEIEVSAAYVFEAHINLDWRPEVPLEIGLERFVAWYKESHA